MIRPVKYPRPVDPKAFSDRLKKVMLARDLTQAQVAEIVGISQPSVFRWLNGTLPSPSMARLAAEKLGVGIEWLLYGEAPIYKPSSYESNVQETPPQTTIVIPARGNDDPEEIIKSIRHTLTEFEKATPYMRWLLAWTLEGFAGKLKEIYREEGKT
jgi:transcriptional regulator with XRE-family HTH domain